MKEKFLLLSLALMLLFNASCKDVYVKNDLRAPAYPLVTVDPYTCAWSFADNLYDGQVKHWTGKDFPLLGVIEVDGETFRFLGLEEPEYEVLAPTSAKQAWQGKYTTEKPDDDWISENFNDSKWSEGLGAFGTIARYKEPANTEWQSEHIWVRRSFEFDGNVEGKKFFLDYTNDDDAVFYINGVKVLNIKCCNKNAIVPLSDEAIKALHQGTNTIAAYCNNPVANGLLDFGLLTEKQGTAKFSKTAVQTSVDVQATQTHYTFTCGKIDLKLTFTAPLLMNDLDLLSRPINYISYEAKSNDENAHEVKIYFEASSRWAIDNPHQSTASKIAFEDDKMILLSTGNTEQNILGKRGDDLRIDWGYFYLGSEKRNTVPEFTDNRLSISENAGQVKEFSGKILLGYDDIYSIQYFGENLRPYWNRSGKETIVNQFQKAIADYQKIVEKCNCLDMTLMREATQSGGKKYAELCVLAYRQSIAAHKLVQAPDGDLLWLSKENFSNGSIGTVDVTYPSAPLYLYYNPELAKGLLNHIFYYSESGKWKKPFPAHDVGTYPLANGQTYGGDMPVEEAGNMLILTAAIAHIEKNAEYAKKHREVLTVWADYLIEKGLDPENQLCTDDFAGHFAHNTNLSVKAILGVASFGYLANKLGDKEIAEKYTGKAREMAQEWVKMANDGDHYRLTFDQAGTWSQKYNLVWDKLLKFGIFPEEVTQKEIAYYQTKQNKYGLPLDNRKTYTKTDWIIWTATLAPDNATFEKFIDPLYLFMNETVDRIPMSDWVFTDKPVHRGFRARSVVGGYFIKLLEKKF